jgi:hypothetical protein
MWDRNTSHHLGGLTGNASQYEPGSDASHGATLKDSLNPAPPVNSPSGKPVHPILFILLAAVIAIAMAGNQIIHALSAAFYSEDKVVQLESGCTEFPDGKEYEAQSIRRGPSSDNFRALVHLVDTGSGPGFEFGRLGSGDWQPTPIYPLRSYKIKGVCKDARFVVVSSYEQKMAFALADDFAWKGAHPAGTSIHEPNQDNDIIVSNCINRYNSIKNMSEAEKALYIRRCR